MKEYPDHITISVTAEDIAAGKPRWCSSCPIALAMKRTLKDMDPAMKVAVSMNTLTIIGPHDDVNYRTPFSAQAFINAFDSGLPTLPFEFSTHKISFGTASA